jgi:hypothetical protein
MAGGVAYPDYDPFRRNPNDEEVARQVAAGKQPYMIQIYFRDFPD